MNVHLNEHVVFRRVGDQIVLIHLTTNQIYELNETSARFWELIAEQADVSAVEARLALEFDVGREQLHEEVEEALSLLLTENLIVRDDER